MRKESPAKWVPTLYFMEALPYVTVNVISVIMYKEMNLSNTELSLFTSFMYLPWVIKPLWSPIVDAFASERKWIIITQLICCLSIMGLALTISTDFWLVASLCFFSVLAFVSATHDIAADGYYILALDSNGQARYVGIRSTFYRVGMIFGQGLLVMMAGWFKHGAPLSPNSNETRLLNVMPVEKAWAFTFYTLAAVVFFLVIYHKFVLEEVYKPNKGNNKTNHNLIDVVKNTAGQFLKTIVIFFTKKNIWTALLFMLLFRFPEAQLVKIASPFMLDSVENGGLALETEFVGLVYGTTGVIGLLLGGIVGGFLVAKDGLKKWLWPMVIAISLPDAVYLYMSCSFTSNHWIIGTCVFVEQLGYGFGFTAYMMYLIYFARGENSTSVYALCTAFMALGMMLPGMAAGWLSDLLGYRMFFIWILIACAITFIVSAFLKIDPEFAKKSAKNVNNS